MESAIEIDVSTEIKAMLTILPKIANAVLWVWSVPVFYPYINYGVYKPEDMLSLHRLVQNGSNTLVIEPEQGLALYRLSRILEGVAVTPYGLETLKNVHGELLVKIDPELLNKVLPFILPGFLPDIQGWLEELPDYNAACLFADQAVNEVRKYAEENPMPVE